jgi:hypothetical protein
VLWKALAQTCRAAGLGDEPRKVFEELSKVALAGVYSKAGRHTGKWLI